jgi:putative ubiquitin-RnfH superfamily antitoxin RatB of RatAB toxin-antitoxin module
MALTLPIGSTVADALRATHWLPSDFADQSAPPSAGVWGRQAPLHQPLRQGDRVELYRPLQVDPKDARRLRYAAARSVKPKRTNSKR